MAIEKPKGWLDKYSDNVAASDATRVSKQLTPTNKNKVTQAQLDEREAQERRKRIALSNSRQANDFDKPAEDLATYSSATADKLRFSDYPNFFDDYINPGVQFGHLASGLGQVPLNIKNKQWGEAAMNVFNPVLAGAGEAVLEPAISQYITDPAKKYVLNPALKKAKKLVLGDKPKVAREIPTVRPSHEIDDLSGTNIGRSFYDEAGQYVTPEIAEAFKLPLYKPGSGAGIIDFSNIKTGKQLRKAVNDKNVSHLFERNKLMHGCKSDAECARLANAIASSVHNKVSPDDLYDYSANADNAWYTTNQMLKNNGEVVYNEGVHGPLTADHLENLQVGDQVMIGPDSPTPHPSYSSATGNYKEPKVNHRATVTGVDENGNFLISESFNGKLVTVPIQNNLYYNANSNFGIRSIIRPSQFKDKAGSIVQKAVENDLNLNRGTMNFEVSPELKPYKEIYDKVKPTLIGNLGINADEADQIFRHVLGIGVQESKMSGKMAKGLSKAKVLIQDKLREAGLTKPVKEVMNLAKKYGNRKYEENPDLLPFPGNSKVQMEANKLSQSTGISVDDALDQLYTNTYNRPKPFALSDTDPSIGTFRQKHLSKTAKRLGLKESDFPVGKGSKNAFYNNPENELMAAFANFYDIKKGLKKKNPDWSEQKLHDMATLSWNSPSKANNPELVDYFYEFKDNPTFEGFDYLNKVKKNIQTHTPLKSVTPNNYSPRAPFLQFNDGGPVQPNYNDYSVSAGPDFEGDGYSNRGRNYSPAWGGQFEQGGKVPFDQWYKTVPKAKNDTINYNLRRAYDLAPQKDLDAFVKDPNAHLMTAYENPETGIYEFMKSKHHSTINKELDWYKSKGGKDFRNKYDLDTTGDYYRYVPKQFAMGGSMPGAVGFTYARVAGAAPDNGKYAKKTKASAENGAEMRYYQEGLDFKPKTISRDGSQLVKLDQLTNFTNYNTKQPGGWLDKYEG
jgi:hypothetical protein